MITDPRIKLDASRLLGFKQIKGALPGHFAGQQAKVCALPPAVPEPSAWVEILLGFLMLGVFALRGHLQKKKPQPGAITASPDEAGATDGLSREDVAV